MRIPLNLGRGFSPGQKVYLELQNSIFFLWIWNQNEGLYLSGDFSKERAKGYISSFKLALFGASAVEVRLYQRGDFSPERQEFTP